MKIQRSYTIENVAGLHARSAALLVQCASRFKSEVTIEKDGEVVNGKSIMGVMMLAALKGSVITIVVSGDDAEQSINAMGELILRKFDEE